jgi:phosphoenolpyruvate carboxylase
MISDRTLEDDVALLTGVLDEVIEHEEGPQAAALLQRAVALGRATREGDEQAASELARLAQGVGLDEAGLLVRALTRWFQLVNLAEDNERVRRVRARALRERPAPRRGSIEEAVTALSAQGADPAQLAAQAELRLVMTAHPTEARRRTTIEKLARVFGVLRELDERRTPDQSGDARRRLLATVQELWGSDELRATTLTVLDEVRGGLVYFTTTLAEVVPRIYRDLEEALQRTDVPPLLTFGTWIGGDRDGNPYVTPQMTLQALELMREHCLRFLEGRVELLAGRLSLSEDLVGPAHGLEPILSHGAELFPALAEQLGELNPREPYRRALTFMRERVRAAARHEEEAGYGEAAQLLADLRTVERSLNEGAGSFTAGGDLHDVIRQVEVFGFHFARLDVREHARVHRRALAEIYADLGVCADYEQCTDEQRTALLRASIADRRPLIPADIRDFSAATRETIETFRMIHHALQGPHRGAIQSYIVSGTEGPTDLLEVLLLCKEASLTRAGGAGAQLRIVPLFEAGATLAAAAGTMRELLACPEYRAALAAVGDEQEIMIGYSDSNKDVGYLASAWGAYRAQAQIAQVLRENDVRWVFFHGRGGAVGRGGGPTNDAILALPPHTVEGRLKMTEQGEVLAAKYAVPQIAHRELELAASATLAAGRLPEHVAPRQERFEAILDEMAERSAASYRALVYEDPRFAEFFSAATPVDEIARLRLGSRPAKRRDTSGIEDLRAIPWVFAWTQARIVLPAWLGLGSALAQAREQHGLELLREMQDGWPFFATLLSNAAMACAKADEHIGRRYSELWSEEPARERIWSQLEGELTLTRRELALIRGGERPLDSEPLLQASIDRRNPYVDPLSFVQIELLRRLREPGEDPVAEEQLRRVSLLTINGIASGLRNTG